MPTRFPIATTLSLVVLAAACLPVSATPPRTLRFERLAMEEGLSQNTVQAMLQDSQGFLWMATRGGINRYDGRGFVSYRYDPDDPDSPTGNWIGGLHEDRAGELWIHMGVGGLIRFDRDGERFVPYLSSLAESGPPADVTVAYEDDRDDFWVGTKRGLFLYDRAADRFDPVTDDRLAVSALFALGDGALWVGSDRGLLRLDRDTLRATTPATAPGSESPAASTVVEALFAGDGRWWLASLEHGLSSARLIDGKLHLEVVDTVPVRSILTLHRDREGSLWMAGPPYGLARYEPEEDRFYRYPATAFGPESARAPRITFIEEDRDRTLWVGSRGAGLLQYDRRRDAFRRHVHDRGDPHSIADDNVLAFLQDRTGVLWFGTELAGVAKLDPRKQRFGHLPSHDVPGPHLYGRPVTAILPVARDRVWVGTGSGGLHRYDPTTGAIERYTQRPGHPLSLCSNAISALVPDHEGNLWIGTRDGGVCRLSAAEQGTSPATARFSRHGPGGGIHSLLVDRRGILWIGTAKRGLLAHDPATGETARYDPDPGDPTALLSTDVWSLYEDRQGTLWVGTAVGGLHRFDAETGSFERFQRDSSVPGSINNRTITTVFEDSRERLWVGTYSGGVNLMDRATGTFEAVTEREGLAGNGVQGILEDEAGRLWLSTDRGLTRYDADRGASFVFQVGDGLLDNEFARAAAARGVDGTLYLGGNQGITFFRPADLVPMSPAPPVVLTGFYKFGRRVPTEQPVSETRELEVSYKDDFIGFEFAALDFGNPAKNRYRYRLEGFDRDWIEAGHLGRAGYTNLDGGSYTLRVQAANSEGVWNRKGLTLALVVVPPFWQTAWFRGLAAVVLLVVVYCGYRLRVRSLEASRRRLEQQVARRTSQLRDKNRELAARGDELEAIEKIVASINSEIDFSRLLQSVLDATCALEGVDRATAFVRDTPSGTFHVAACSAGPSERPLPELSADEVSRICTRGADRPARGLHLHRGGALEYPLPSGVPAAKRLAVEIEVEGRVDGYLLLDAVDPEPFDDRDVELLVKLREHFTSAFVKTRLLQELQALNEKKNHFLGVAAHDLRNPLSVIAGQIELLQLQIRAGKLDPDIVERKLEAVLAASRRMKHLVNTLLDISAIESGKVELDLRRGDLAGILRQAESFHADMAARKQLGLVLEAGDELPPVMFDSQRIAEVLDNLLSNAVKYTHPGGQIRVWCESGPAEVVVSVQDTGQGLGEDEMDDLFKDFKRLSARPTGGESSTGLGLAIVKKLVELHGGRVWAVSRKGEGSTFSFALPRVPVAPEPTRVASAAMAS